MWKYGVINCPLIELERKMNQRQHLQESERDRFKVRPMGLATYEENGQTKCILAYGWKKRK